MKENTNKSTKKPTRAQIAKRQRERYRKALRNMGFVICALLVITIVVTTIYVAKLNVLPLKHVVLIDIVLVIITAWLIYMQKWITPGIIAKVIALVMAITLVLASIYVNYTYSTLKKMTGVDTKLDVMNVLVLVDDKADSIQDAADYKFGRMEFLDQKNTDDFVEAIEDELDKTIDITNYESAAQLAEALYAGEVQAILLNGSYVNFITGLEGYENFLDEVKSIYEMEIETEISVSPENEDYLSNGEDVFTIYVSGIDTRGNSPKVNSNSDVNILMTINKKTRQILLISTPRDFYVPLSISNGVPDKLTHAGGYGIDVSVDTLEMLYEVNVKDYVKINFTGFVDIIDAVGGITVYSDQSFYTNSGYYFEEGYNDLNGEEALAFARERYHVEGGDRGRGNHQMDVIEAVIDKVASSELLSNYTEVLDSLSDSMVTSMSYDEISDLAKFQLNDMRGWDVVKYSVDGTDASKTTFSAGSQELYVMVPDETTVEQAKKYLRQIYAGEKIVITD